VFGVLDARDLARIEHAQPQHHASLRDEQRHRAIVEARDVHVGGAAEADLPGAHVDLGAAAFGHPQVVAGRDREVDADRRPVGRTILGSVVDLATQVGDAAHARGSFVVTAALLRRGTAGAEREPHRQHGDADPSGPVPTRRGHPHRFLPSPPLNAPSRHDVDPGCPARFLPDTPCNAVLSRLAPTRARRTTAPSARRRCSSAEPTRWARSGPTTSTCCSHQRHGHGERG